VSREPVLVFTVLAAHGIRGALRVAPTGSGHRLLGRTVHVGERLGEGVPRRVRAVTPQRQTAIVELEGIRDRTAAEALRGYVAWVPADELPLLPEGEYYAFALEGRRVAASDQELGTVREVLPGVAHDLLVVRAPGGRDILVPFVHDLVASVEPTVIALKVPARFFDADDAS
jgi:16S rRNA processing protein RimM